MRAVVRSVLRGETRLGARAVAALMGADPDDPEVRAGATLLLMGLMKLISPETLFKMDVDDG